MPETVDVGAAAQLDGAVAGVHHPHSLTVLVAEERDRPLGLRFGARQLLGPNRQIAQDLGVNEVFHLVELGPGHRLVMREVKTQPVGGHEGAVLLDVGAEHLPQRPVEEVGPGVVPPDGRSPLGIDHGPSLLARRDVALFDHGEVAVEARAAQPSCRAPELGLLTVEMVPVSPTCPPASA